MKSKLIFILMLIAIFGYSCKPDIDSNFINECKRVGISFLSLNNSSKIYNIYTADMLGVGFTNKKKVTVLTSDTSSEYFEISTDEINRKNITITDSLKINNSIDFLNFEASVEFVKQKQIYGLSMEQGCVVFSFATCCPRLRIALTKNPFSFFKNAYGEDYLDLIKNEKNGKKPWVRKIDAELYEYLINDIM